MVRLRFALAALVLPALLLAGEGTEAERIEGLIRAVEGLEGAVFIRNGDEHTAREAGQHLRLKLRMAGDKVRTAEDFIRLCGTGSSGSGKPYLIRLKDGREVPCADFLAAELAKANPFRGTFRGPQEALTAVNAREPSAPKAGDPAPDLALKDPEGKRTVRLSDYKGKAPVVLLFGSYT